MPLLKFNRDILELQPIASIRLERTKNEVMNIWAKRVRSEVPAAKNQNDEDLRDALPGLLSVMVTVISSSSEIDVNERLPVEAIELCQEHGKQRAALQAYTLEQVISEYRVLRQTLLEVLEREQPLSFGERSKLLDCIDHGISEAATAFARSKKSKNKKNPYQRVKADVVAFKAKLDKSRGEVLAVRSQRDESRFMVEQLERDRELREKFVATLSHDLRTPLSAAKMSAEIIRRTGDNCARHSALAAQVVKNIERLDRMIIDLLDTNRIRAGAKVALKIEKCDLNSLVSQTLDELITIHGNRFQLEFNTNVWGYWSPDGIQRMIENLVSNAVKYGDPNTPIRIIIRKAGDQVHIAVHNQGNAIALIDQNHLFKPFLRTTSAQVSGQKGWGLGLTLVRGIAEGLGGHVTVESTSKEGTLFTITLPRDSRPFQNR